MAWYVIHTYSGYENKVKLNLESRLEAMNLSDKVSQIVIPTVEVTEIKGGKKASVAKKFFPGYILIEMEMLDDTWYVVKHTPGIFGFVGDNESVLTLFSQARPPAFFSVKVVLSGSTGFYLPVFAYLQAFHK